MPFVRHGSLRGLEAPFGAGHVADVRSHSAGDSLEGHQEVLRKKKNWVQEAGANVPT